MNNNVVLLDVWVIKNYGQMINDSIINSRAMCIGVLQGLYWFWSSLIPLMIQKKK